MLFLVKSGDRFRYVIRADTQRHRSMKLDGRIAHYDLIAQRMALKRWAPPDDVAGSVVFLTLPASNYVTGTMLAEDGGFGAG
jgi:NAD(P)-dependent dehydrogenase (short-subunit alcohol dehydrogenase family)